MAGFGFSISDIVAVGTFAWNIYKSCKSAGDDFRAITQDVGSLQAVLREIGDEAGNPTSIIHKANGEQRAQFKIVVKSCKIDLQELERILAKHKSLGTANARMRDKLGLTAKRRQEMQTKLTGHTDRLNLFLTHLHSGALGRIEANTEAHTRAFAGIREKLDAIHDDVKAGKKNPSLLLSMDEWGSLERELVDDTISEADVAMNKENIRDWLDDMNAISEEEDAPEPGQSSKPSVGTNNATAGEPERQKEGIKLPEKTATLSFDPTDNVRKKMSKKKYHRATVESGSEDDHEQGDKNGHREKSGQKGIQVKPSDEATHPMRATAGDISDRLQSSHLNSPLIESDEDADIAKDLMVDQDPESDASSEHGSHSTLQRSSSETSLASHLPNTQWRSFPDISRQGQIGRESLPQEARRYQESATRPGPSRRSEREPGSAKLQEARRYQEGPSRRIPLRQGESEKHSAMQREARRYQEDMGWADDDEPPHTFHFSTTPDNSTNKSGGFSFADPNDTFASYFRQPHEGGMGVTDKPSNDNKSGGFSFVHTDKASKNNMSGGFSFRDTGTPSNDNKSGGFSFGDPNDIFAEFLRAGRGDDATGVPGKSSGSREQRQTEPPNHGRLRYEEDLRQNPTNPFFNTSPPPSQTHWRQENYGAPRPDYRTPGPDDDRYQSSHGSGRPKSYSDRTNNAGYYQDPYEYRGATPLAPFSPPYREQRRAASPEVTIVERPLPVSLEDLFHGTTKKMKIKSKRADPITGMSTMEEKVLEVPIKPGLMAGSKIKYSNVGDSDTGVQDLHLVVEEKPHPLFKREGNDLRFVCSVTLMEALTGWQRPVNTIDGKQVQVQNGGVTAQTWQETFPGLGMPISRKPGNRGDMVVSVSIKFPTTLNTLQKRAIKDLLGE